MAHGGTQIVVALIGVAGVISAAAIANYDNLVGGEPTRSPAVAQTTPTPMPAASPDVAPAAEKVQALADAQGDLLGESTAVLDRIATQIRDSSGANISGAWRDADGYSYAVEQKGASYAYQQYQAGTMVGAGEGQIEGRTLRHGFTSVYGPGECVGQVAPDNSSIEGMCGNGSNSWPFRISR